MSAARPLFIDPLLISEEAFFHLPSSPISAAEREGRPERNPRRKDMWRRPGRRSLIAARTPGKEEIERNS
jgi:hypothetical protein